MIDQDLVGIQEIAARLRVQSHTVDQWRHRGRMPEPEAIISGTPIWEWSTIYWWASETGRLATLERLLPYAHRKR